MSNIIGGSDTGVFDSSLFLLNRSDRTGEGTAGHGEELYVNVSNGNLVVMHQDAFLPSQGDDFVMVRTYNSRGIWGSTDGKGWSNNAIVVELSQITNGVITLISADASRSRFYLDAASGNYISVDGAGAYEVISYDKTAKTYSLTRSNQTVYDFDNTGNLKSSRDTNGNRIDYTYAQGKLQQLKDDQGHVITYVYSNGDLVQVKDEQNNVLASYEYAQGQMTAAVDRAGHRTVYTYYTSGELQSITLPSDANTAARTLSFQYDADTTDNTGKTKLLRWLTDGEGSRTYFEYQFNVDNFSKYNGGTTTVVTALGINRRESNAAEYVQWRLANGLYATWDANRYASDAAYKAQADAVTARHTVRYAYDKNGAITSVIDQAGYQTTYQYDAKENLTAIVDPNGYAATRSDDTYWRNIRRDYGYVDAAGQGKPAAQLSAAEVAAILAHYTTRLEYDARGNLTKKTDNAGNVTTYTYTAFNKVASQTSAMGNALATSDEASVQDKRAELGYARSAAALTAADQQALRALYTTTYSYDARQNVIELRSPGGDLTRFEYDSYGNRTKRIVFLDAADLVTPAKQQVTQYFYDAYGQNIRTVDAEGFSTYNTFDHYGNLLSHTDARGGVTSYTYDNDNRVLTVTDPEGHVTVNAYDAVGNRTSVRDANGHTTLYVYDRNNMLVTTIDPNQGDASQNRVTSFTYDVTGNRTAVQDAEGRRTVYVYREDNRLLEVRTPVVADAAGTGQTQYSTFYEYDGLGNRIAAVDRNGARTELVYNESGLLKRSTDAVGNVTEYRYDANLNQIQVVVGAQLAVERRRVLRFSFDEEDQRVAETDAMGGTTRYVRDAVGNVTAVTDANGHTQQFSFDRNNRLVTETRAAILDATTGAQVVSTVTHQYDGNGNVIATTDENGHTTTYAFDKDNQLVLVQDANGIKTAYSYDSRHNRTSVAVGVQAHLDANGRVVIDSTADALVETTAYNEFNEVVSRTDGVGNALVSSDSALYSAIRQQLGYAASVAGLTAADKQALLAAYTQRFAYDRVGNTVTVTDHLGRVTSMRYDALNREIQRTDALGQSWLQRFDGNGNRVAVVDALGRTQTFAYDAANRLVSQTDALGVVTTQAWDNVGNLLSSTQAAGTADARTQRFEYDLNNRVTRSVDAMGVAQAYEYDAVGNRLQVVDGRGNATRYVYDARNRLLRTIDPLGFETRYEYDGVGNRVTVIDARGGITRFTYDPGNRLVALTDAEGRVTQYEYDARGNRITQRTAAGTALEEVTHFEYDAQGHLRAVVDAEGHRSTQDYDAAYNRVAVTDGNGHTTRYAFDALNRQVQVTDALGDVTAWSYDAVGNRLSQTDAKGRVTSWSYDADNRTTSQTDALGVVTQWNYDAVGNRIEQVRAAGLAEAQRTTYQYDLDNRLVGQTDALGHVTRTEYDANGNAVATVDPLGHRTSYEYDANNRVVRIVDALGNAVQYRYDGNGNRIQVIDALGHATTSYYNRDNELTLSVNAEGEATSYAYDANGNLVAQTRFGQRVAGALDPNAAAPALASSPADRTSRFAYDHLNRLTHALDGEGHLVLTAYDAVGNVTATRAYAAPQSLGGAALGSLVPQTDPKDRLTQYSYDAANRRVSQVDAEGFTTTWAYDAVGNRTEQVLFLSRTDFSTPALQQRTVYGYDALNRLVEQTSPLGVRTAITYDARGNRTGVTDAAGTPDARSTAYAYDAADRLVSQTDALGTVTRYELDADGRITAEIRADGQPEARRTAYGYDAVGRVVETVYADGTRQVQVYDAAGNLSARSDAAGTSDAHTTTFSYDRADRLVATVLGAGTPEALVTSYTLNAFGERVRQAVADGTADARVVHNAYDHLGRLIARTDGNGIVTLSDYDAFGNLVATHVTGSTLTAGGASVQRTETSTFEYDGRNLLIADTDGLNQRVERQYDGAGNLRFQVDAAGSGAARTTEFRYDLGNRLVAKIVDPAGLALTTGYAYDARGNLVTQTNADGLATTTRFDLLDRAIVTTDGEGFSVSFAYDRFGSQTAVTTGQYLPQPGDAGYDAAKAARAFPAVTHLVYDAMGRKTQQVDALGTITRYAYDARGNRVLQSEADGTAEQRVSSYSYDAADRLVDEVQPVGTVIHYTYTAAGEKASKTVDYGAAGAHVNATTRWFYDAGGRVAFEADPVGAVTQHQYDDFGNQVRVVRGLGGLAPDGTGQPSTAATADMRVTAYEFDAAHRMTAEVVDPDGLALRTAYEYDARNNKTAIIDGNGARTDMAYDAADRAVWVRDGAGYVTTAEYNGRGLRIADTRYANAATGLAVGALPPASAQDRRSTSSYDAAGRLVESTDARGVVTRTAYDAIGNRLSVTENATGLYGALARVTRYTYTAANQVKTQVDPSGLVTAFSYDAVYNLTEKRVANTWRDTVANRDASYEEVTRYTYDRNNRLTDQVVDATGLNLHTGWTYDSLGNRTSETSPNGTTARTWYDAGSRAVLTVDANGNARSAEYDAVGNLVRSTVHDAVGGDRVTDHVFDKADRLTLERGPAANQLISQTGYDQLFGVVRVETSRIYDAAGNVLRTIDGNGNVTYRYYDGANRLIGKLDAAGYLTVFTNDAFGNVVQESLSLDQSTLSISQKEALDLAGYVPPGPQRVISHGFDAGNHEVLTVYPASELLENGASTTEHLQVNRSFDAFGSLLSETVKHRESDANSAATHYAYDTAGRLLSKTDAQLDELLTSNAPQIVALRRDLGLGDVLTDADRLRLTAQYTTTFGYDAVGNVRDQNEGGRVTTFQYDGANRTVRVIYPATTVVEVGADGSKTVTEGYRAEATRELDANGNLTAETKPNGERVVYRYDAANRQVAALSNGVYVSYEYNAAGDVTRIHRYFNTTDSVAAPPPEDAVHDQVIEISVDALGRKTAERQVGILNDGGADDRVVQYFYDANGNQVRSVDARGNPAITLYDGLNRLVGTYNREGGVTSAGYDAEGNVVSRQTGGFTAPSLRGGVTIDRVSDSGAVIEWSTDRATNATVFVRRAGSGDAWTSVSVGSYVADHRISLSGLAADTDYEFYIVSNDSFGFQLSSQGHPSTLHTAVGIGQVAVSGVHQVGSDFAANVSFNVPAGAANVRVLAGSGNAGDLTLGNSQAFAAVRQSDGSYTAALSYASADALFQIEWTDAQGVHRTGASAIVQTVSTQALDVTLRAVPEAGSGSGSNATYQFTASWNLADVLSAGGVSVDDTDPLNPTYAVFIGVEVDGAAPVYQQATLVDGRFTVTFNNQRDTARVIHLQYVRPDGTTVEVSPVPLTGLSGLDQRLQNLQFDFPDTNTSGATLSVRTRAVSGGAWTNLPASSINGLSANLLGLAAGGYEYEATLTRGGQVLRRAGGSFSLGEPASLAGLNDTANAGAVGYVLSDAELTLSSLLPVGSDEQVTFTLKDDQGATVAAQFTDGTLDVAALQPGSYTLHAVKTRGTAPAVTVNDITGTLVVGPLTLGDVQNSALEGSRSLLAYAVDATRTQAVQITVGGMSSADHSWNFFDANGLRLFSNESGGVWTRYFYDSRGNVTKEVRFQRRDGAGNFIDSITDQENRPSLQALMADYDSSTAAGGDHVRITLRTWDAAGHMLSETESSTAHGDVTSRYAYDRWGNKVVQTTAAGLGANLQSTIRTTYDAAGRVVRVETGPFDHIDEADHAVNSSAAQAFDYDRRGNQTVSTDARGFEVRMRYDSANRLVTQWDGQRAGQGPTLQTDHAYDAFGRLVSLTNTDLTGRAAQHTQSSTYAWSAFDQLTRFTDAMGHSTQRTYDLAGNQTSETDAANNTTYFAYSAENRMVQRTDRLGGVWRTGYDAYGQRISETDANGRVTSYVRGAFGQLLGSSTGFAGGYGSLAGAGQSSETQRFDWLGRLVETTDSFGKHYIYAYNDADEQVHVTDAALGKEALYGYDAVGRRVSEELRQGGLTQRTQTMTYNNQGWLTNVSADAGSDFGGGAVIHQMLDVGYQFDAAGNRVRVRQNANPDGSAGGETAYSYDGAGRMLKGMDDNMGTGDVAVNELRYDGFGNRVFETRGGVSTAYTYDADNRVTSSTAGETWQYDVMGNVTAQHNNADNTGSTSVYNAENRVVSSVSTDREGKSTSVVTFYDGVGNVSVTRTEGGTFGYTEVTQRDVRYLEQSVFIKDTWAKGAKGLSGATSFQYDVNGHLTMLDRGQNQSTKQQSVSFFEYDIDGQIIGRAEKATAQSTGNFFMGYLTDPDIVDAPAHEFDYNPTSATQRAQSMLFYMQGSNGTASFTSYLYVNNKPVAQAQGSQSIALKKLTLQGAEPVYESTVHPGEDGYTENKLIAHTLTLAAEDLVSGADGQLDRAATALRIAQLHYSGFDQLSADGQAKLLAYIQGQLQSGTSPQPVAVGSKVLLSAYILLTESSLGNVTQITDYSLRQVGALGGLPGSTAQTHVVRAGDTLQSIAQMYLGSSSYWYLIADANGLTGSEKLTEGTTLTIPNRIANSANTYDTFKVYNETEIIGTTSPEIRTIQKKKSFFQKLIMIVIIVIMIVAAVITAGAALAAAGAATPGLLGVGASLAGSLATSLGFASLAAMPGLAAFGLAVGIGAATFAAASILTQGLAVAAGLQESFSWKQVGKAAISGAVSGAAGYLGGSGVVADLFGNSKVAASVAIEMGKQLAVDGKISNVAGIAGAAIGAGAFEGLGDKGDLLRTAGEWAGKNAGTVTAGLSLIESAVRGKGDNSMQWVNLATSALFESTGLRGENANPDAANRPGTPNYLGKDGSLNWGAVAVQAVGTAIVGSRMGTDAATSYLGNVAGEFVVQGAGKAWDDRNIPAPVTASERRAIMDQFDGSGLQGAPLTFGEDHAMRRAASNPMGLSTAGSAAGVADGAPGRGITQIVADLSQSRSYTAQSGDSISRILGTSDPQAIGNFMRANGLTNSTIYAGQDYVIPGAMNTLGDNSALGQGALNADNARLQAIVDAKNQAAAPSAQEVPVANAGSYADYRDPRDFQASFGYRSMVSRQLADAAPAQTPIASASSSVSAWDALGMGWNREGWSILEHGPMSERSVGASLALGFGQGSRDLFDGLSGAGFMAQAQQSWNEPGQAWKSPLYAIQALGAAALTAFGIGEFAMAGNTTVATMSARELAAARASYLGDPYSNHFVGPVQWEYFYRGDSVLRSEFLSSMAKSNGLEATESFLRSRSTGALGDIMGEHGVSSAMSPFISTSRNPSVAEYFARGPSQTQGGVVTTFRVEAREAEALRNQGRLVANADNPMSFFEPNPAIGLPEAEFLFGPSISSRYIYQQIPLRGIR